LLRNDKDLTQPGKAKIGGTENSDVQGMNIEVLPSYKDCHPKEEAVQWITENKEQPFFLYLAHNMPHAPIFASNEFQGRSEGGRLGDVAEEIDWSVRLQTR